MLNNPNISPNTNSESSQPSKPIFSSNLAAVLNDPRKDRAKKSYFFTQTWGSDFIEHSNFKSIKSDLSIKNFDSHLNETNERLKNHNNNKNFFEKVSSNSKLNIRHFGDSNSLSLEQIPKIFFDSNFNLSDRQTFESVIKFQASLSKHHKVQNPFESHSKGLKNDAEWCKLVLNKFSFYLDIIESHITKQISSKANTFFNAIHSQDEVQEHILKTSSQVKQIRRNMNTLNKESILSSIRILKLVALKIRYQKFLDKLELLSTVHQNQPAIQIHLASSEYNGALEIISFSQEILRQDLKFIRCLRHFDSQFQEIGKVIEKMINQDFIKYLNGELSRDAEEKCDIQDENRLFSLVSSLMKIKSYDFIDMSREEIDLFVKSTFKMKLAEKISQLDNDEENSNSIPNDTNNFELIERVKLLTFDHFLDLIKLVLNNFKILICRIELIVSFMVNVFKENQFDKNENNKEAVCQNGWFKVEDKLNDLLIKTIDFVQEILITVLDAKFKEGNVDKISSLNFSLFSKLIDDFVTSIDRISKNKTATLRSWLQNHTSKLLNKFHLEQKDKLVLAIDSESWKISEIPSDFQNILDKIIKDFYNQPANFFYRILNESGSNFLYINEEKQIFFGMVVTLLKITLEYVQMESAIPGSSFEVSNKVIELYSIFNQKTFQMILGVGAIETGLLKVITFKTLALTFRSLDIVLKFIPLTRDYFLNKVEKKTNVERQFNKLISVFHEHVNELNNKLINMIDDKLGESISVYEVKAPVPSQSFRSICSQIEKVYQLLIDLLPETSIKKLFIQVDEKFKTRLKNRLMQLKIPRDGGPQYAMIFQDMTFYEKQLKNLPFLSGISTNFQDIWN